MTRVNQLIKEALLSKDNKLDTLSQIQEEYPNSINFVLLRVE